MRINGRTLRPSTLAERRFLLSLGIAMLRVPRGMNPYAVARRIRRVIRAQSDDLLVLRELAQGMKKNVATKAPFEVPRPSPDVDLPEPIAPAEDHEQAA